jgi:hypothetical protein
MKFNKIKFTIAIILTIIFGLLAIPQFKVKLGENEYSYPNIDLSFLNSNSKLGNFQKGEGLYGSNIVSATVNFDETQTPDQKQIELETLLNTIQQRIDYSENSVIKLSGEVTNSEYKLNFEFPQYISNPIQYVKWLTSDGLVTFASDPQLSTLPVNLTDKDIDGEVSVTYLDIPNSQPYKTHFVFKIEESKVEDLKSALANQSQVFLMQIDDQPFGVITYERTTFTNIVRAIPVGQFANELDKENYLKIAKTYFLSEPLNYSLTVSDNVKQTNRQYALEGAQILAVTLILSALAITIHIYSKFGLKRTISYILSIASFSLLLIVLMKFLGVALSIYVLIGFIMIFFVAIMNIISLLKTTENNHILKTFRNLSVVLMITLAFSYKLNLIGVQLSNMVIVLFLGFFVLLIMNSFFFKQFLSINKHE